MSLAILIHERRSFFDSRLSPPRWSFFQDTRTEQQCLVPASEPRQFSRLRNLELLRVTKQPNPVELNAGTLAIFNVVASGEGILRYQWRLNEVDIPGATNTWLSIPKVQQRDAGQCTVRISDDLSWILSAPATLTVRVSP